MATTAIRFNSPPRELNQLAHHINLPIDAHTFVLAPDFRKQHHRITPHDESITPSSQRWARFAPASVLID